jgi:hypothetical protein
MQPAPEARPEFVAAFAALAGRIAATLTTVDPQARPIQMIVAGGAAMHLYTGARVSRDIDAAFSHRIALPQDLRVAYRDADGRAQTLYFDYQYNDSLALMHEDANSDAVPLSVPGIDPALLDIRLLAPVDLAISKLARFAEVDRGDITELGRKGLINAAALRQRANEALAGYIGDLTRVRRSIDMACNLVEDVGRNLGG